MQVKVKATRIISGFLSCVLLVGSLSAGFSVSYGAEAAYQVPAGTTAGGNVTQENIPVEESFVNDIPIRLQVSKIKTRPGDHEGITPDSHSFSQKDTVTYMYSGRVEGSAANLIQNYGEDGIELAYSSSGVYLGYGWHRGTLEYLLFRQKQSYDEELQIMYNAYGIFDGYAYVTRKLETADDENRYVAGATMALYDAVEVAWNPEVMADGNDWGEDERLLGVTVVRDSGSNNVTSTYVRKGYAGTDIKYVLQKNDEAKIIIDGEGNVIDGNYNYQDEINDKGKGTWVAQTIQREDTPVLFYSLDNLHVTSNDVYTSRSYENQKLINKVYGEERYDKDRNTYGFDKAGNVVDITQTTETDFSIFVFEDGTNIPVFEIYGGDYSKIRYSLPEKIIEVGAGTRIYHLDKDGNRDSMVDPQTGIAYIENEASNRGGSTTSSRDMLSTVFLWPVNVFYDGSGANSGNKNGSRTFQKIITTRLATINADTANEYTTGTYDGKKLVKHVNPVLDQYGHPVYYRQSDQTYQKGTDIYDYDGDEYMGYIYKDSLDAENENAYSVNDHDSLYNGDLDDPFDQSTHYQYTDKQTILITVDIEGNYIVNGSSTVPVPRREGYLFAGWLMEPDQLSDGGTVKAYWRNQNSSGMGDEEKEQWYSNRAAAGPVKKLKITFDGNGGEFRSGSGDIHSADNILYRKLGEAYLMENIWTSGENTPNDPFDMQMVDTIENTASGANTISGTGQTGNDVYSMTRAGGQADMLKRVNAGTYIMEETAAPLGYVKSLPVAVSVKEDSNVQYAEMIDKTIKVEFVKIDAPDTYQKNIYLNGVLQEDAAGSRQHITESMGGYTFTAVPGATISLKAGNLKTEKLFSDWVKVSQLPQVEKKISNGSYYLEFQSDVPLFLEGIPAGEYVLSEVTVPDGYIPMPDQVITITESDGVQLYQMYDDHTKLEIEKYYNEENSKSHLPNSHRAELTLVDGAGTTVAVWSTDDISDYTNTSKKTEELSIWQKIQNLFVSQNKDNDSFITLFTDRVKSGDTNFTSISWNVDREAVLAPSSTPDRELWIISDGTRIECNEQTPPATAPEGFQSAYPKRNLEEKTFTYQEVMSAVKDEAASSSLSNQIWNVSNGSRLHICISPGNETGENGRPSYITDFKFNYRNDYPAPYSRMVSYDTIDGLHRFDYIPKGVYVLKESKTPEGFITAADKTVVVKENSDIQRYTLENKKKQLVIGKTALKGDSYYAGTENGAVVESMDSAQAAVVAGAGLSLYYSETQIPAYENAFNDGAVPANTRLFDSWVSGEDGVYTEEEYLAELIRGDQVGDLKPHIVQDVVNGYYYLVETDTPAYYRTFTPIEIHVTDQSSEELLTKIMGINEPIPMQVKVHKKNNDGNPLSGAVFAVKNKTLGGIDVGTLSTDENGNGSLVVTDIGRLSIDGKLEPYTFTLQEVSAPAGYQLDRTIHEFQPSADCHGLVTSIYNEADSAISEGTLWVINEPSKLSVSKSDFQSGLVVPGAALTVYEAEFQSGRWVSTGVSKESDWTWITNEKDENHTLTGLTAGAVYVIQESNVPAGYTKADDIFFKVSAAGDSIEKIWYDPEEISFVSFQSDSTGAVESVTFSTRTILGTYVILTDLNTDNEINKGTLASGEVYLSADDIEEGHYYKINEFVQYSDGMTDCLGTTTFLGKLNEGWMRLKLNAEVTDLAVVITDSSGNGIYQFQPDHTSSYTINNPILTSPDNLTVIGSLLQKTGVDHKAVQAGDQIRYQISYKGAGKEITVLPAEGLTYIHTAGVPASPDGAYRFISEKDSGTITMIATVNPDAAGFINQLVSIDGRKYSYMNPIAVNGGDGVFANSSKLVISSAVEGTHPENENSAFTFKITLTKADGSPLSGAYDYRTKNQNGRLEAFGKYTTFEITVNGNDFITIRDLPYNTEYSVVQIVPSDYQYIVTNTKAAGKTSNTGVSNVLFTNTRNETSERVLFQQNTRYFYEEILKFANNDSTVLKKYGFSFGSKCQVYDVSVLNKPTEVWFSKTDWTDTEELPGATCVLMDEEGNLLYDALGNPLEWVSGETPKKWVGVLEAGKTYRYHEEAAPAGYSYSEDIIFTVSEDGTIDKVLMQDKPTAVYFLKTDFAGEEVPGASCELQVEEDGQRKVLDTWVSGISPHKIEGILEPGSTYYYHEASAPDGYAYSEDICFRLDKNGMIKEAYYVGPSGNILLHDKNGYVTQITVTEDMDGNELFMLEGLPVLIDQHGNALTGDGELIAVGVQKYITVEDNVIQMRDKPFYIDFSKEDFAGAEVAGAVCRLDKVNPDGSVSQIKRWITDGSPHRISGLLCAGATYRYIEETSAGGYYYSEAIEFYISKDGVVTEAYYINSDGTPILFDREGYPTRIIVEADGSYSDNGRPITINTEGNAVDEYGTVHAEGVSRFLPVHNNALKMIDAPIKLRLIKTDENGNAIKGGIFQILNTDRTPVLACRDTRILSLDHEGTILAGEPLRFQSVTSENGVEITGQLEAGIEYLMHEEAPPGGYIAQADRKFQVPYINTSKIITVTMENQPTVIRFSKEDIAGAEIPGAACMVEKINPDQTTTVLKRWVSSNEPMELVGQLDAETTYRYHETGAPAGYAYSETIEFTINRKGVIADAYYVNQEGTPILYDKEGYPTNITVNPDNTYSDGTHVIIIDENGNAVDENGEIHALGVKFKIPVSDNMLIMKDAPTKTLMIKTDLNGVVLTGGSFQILDISKNVVTAIKDTRIPSTEHNGTIKAGELLIFEAARNGVEFTGLLNAGETYILREINPPTGYLASEDMEFKIPYLISKEPLEICMTNAPTEVHFSKTDWTDTQEIPGATCQLKDEQGNIVLDQNGDPCQWTSTTEPKIFTGVLEPGKTYIYHEEIAPDTYGYSEDVIFTVNTDGEIQKVTMKDRPTEVLITKYTSAQGEDGSPIPLEGAKLQILHMDGTPVLAIRNSVVGEDGTVQFTKGDPLIFISQSGGTNITGMLNADTSYILRELESPAGYHRAADVPFTTSRSGALIRVTMYDNPTKARILKVDSNATPLSGAALEVRDAVNWDILDHWISDGTARDVMGVLTVGKEYALVESASPEGYYISAPVFFTLKEGEEVTEISMTDSPTVVKLIKVRKGTAERLSGGKFSILKKSDLSVIVPEFTLNGELIITAQLIAGETYLFHEIEAPEGYTKSSDVEFTLPLEAPEHTIEIMMENEKKGGGNHDGGGSSNPPTIIFKKYDGATLNALPGAEITIYDSNGKVYKKVTTDSQGYATVSFTLPGTYTYVETKAPDGYLADLTPHTIDVKKSETNIEHLPNYHTPPEVVITKKDNVTGEVISGVRFEVTNENGKVVYTGTTDIYGQVHFKPDQYGPYAVREIKVPKEYALSQNYITFTVTASGVEGETIFFNTEKGIPPLDNPGKSAGTIEATYDNGADAYGKGWFDRDGIWHPFAKPSKTGDFYPFAALVLVSLLGAAGLLYEKKRGRIK